MFLFLLTIFIASCSNEDSSVLPQESNLINPKSNSSNEMSKLFGGGSISFGIGRTSRNCAGFGICRINSVSVTVEDYTITWTHQNRPNLKCNYLKVDNDNFYLLIDNSIVGELKTIEGGDDFIFEESFTFDQTTTSTIGISPDFTVAVGKYPIVYDSENDIYKILLTNSIK